MKVEKFIEFMQKVDLEEIILGLKIAQNPEYKQKKKENNLASSALMEIIESVNDDELQEDLLMKYRDYADAEANYCGCTSDLSFVYGLAVGYAFAFAEKVFEDVEKEILK